MCPAHTSNILSIEEKRDLIIFIQLRVDSRQSLHDLLISTYIYIYRDIYYALQPNLIFTHKYVHMLRSNFISFAFVTLLLTYGASPVEVTILVHQLIWILVWMKEIKACKMGDFVDQYCNTNIRIIDVGCIYMYMQSI